MPAWSQTDPPPWMPLVGAVNGRVMRKSGALHEAAVDFLIFRRSISALLWPCCQSGTTLAIRKFQSKIYTAEETRFNTLRAEDRLRLRVRKRRMPVGYEPSEYWRRSVKSKSIVMKNRCSAQTRSQNCRVLLVRQALIMHPVG